MVQDRLSQHPALAALFHYVVSNTFIEIRTFESSYRQHRTWSPGLSSHPEADGGEGSQPEGDSPDAEQQAAASTAAASAPEATSASVSSASCAAASGTAAAAPEEAVQSGPTAAAAGAADGSRANTSLNPEPPVFVPFVPQGPTPVHQIMAELEYWRFAQEGRGVLTTAMLKNIPEGWNSFSLSRCLDSYGFSGRYFLVYVPLDYVSGLRLGYGILGFESNADALNFKVRFEGLDNGIGDSAEQTPRTFEVRWFHRHGRQAHIDAYRNGPLMHHLVPQHFKPILFEGGRMVEFPGPTRPVQPPRQFRTASDP